MTARRQYIHKNNDPQVAEKININEDRLFKLKLESRFHRENTGINAFLLQDLETGKLTITPTGSATVQITRAFEENKNRILVAWAVAQHSAVTAKVADVTNSEITVVLRSDVVNTAGGNYTSFSDVASDGCELMYAVLASNP